MTNSSLVSALECALALALLAGCGPKDGAKDLAKAEAALAANDLVKADRFTAKALAVEPRNADALATATMVKIALGQIQAADEFIARAMDVAGGDADIRFLDAETAYHLQDYDRAVADYRAVLSAPDASAAERSQALAGVGAVEMTRNEYAAARTALLEAVRLDRHNTAARYHLGYLYRNAFGYLEAALEQYGIYVRLEKTDAERVRKVQRGAINELREEIAAAAAHRPGASKRDSAASARALAKAEKLAKGGTAAAWKAARPAYKESFEADVLSFPAAFGLAQAIDRSDSTVAGRAAALEAYKTAAALRPSSSRALLRTGELAAALGRHAVAAEAYSRAVAANPADITAIDGLIRALRKCGGRAAEASVYQRYRDNLPRKRK